MALVRGAPRTRANQKKWGTFKCPFRGILLRHQQIRPISVILTTLAAHSYEGEETIADALFAILTKMDQFILRDHYDNAVIPNPTDPAENFADKWIDHPEREEAFYAWLGQAREDFQQAAELADRLRIQHLLECASSEHLAQLAA